MGYVDGLAPTENDWRNLVPIRASKLSKTGEWIVNAQFERTISKTQPRISGMA